VPPSAREQSVGVIGRRDIEITEKNEGQAQGPMLATLYACRDAQSTPYTSGRASRHPFSLHTGCSSAT
jgi:hypothetical protein